MRLAAPALLVSLALTGCAIAPTASPIPEQGLALQGTVHGGQQPIVGAHVYLLAANTTGYGGSGIAPSAANASLSLLTAPALPSDAIGKYVTTASDGSFSITNDYSCAAGQQVYLYALGGNPGAGSNSAAGLMAILGNCPGGNNAFLASEPYIWINEVSTIAAAYAMAGFATDATHVSSSGTALAKTGIANAFLNATNLASLSTGVALATTPAGNGTVPQTTINTLANILASCVNSTGPTSSPCATLFTNTLSLTTTPVTPTDTATAAIDIAHNPGANVMTLYAIPAPTVAFSPALTTRPNDFTVGLFMRGGASTLAIDGAGNVWTADGFAFESDSLVKYTNLGAEVSLYFGGGLDSPYSLAVDQSENVWAANFDGGSVSKFSSAGVALSPSGGYSGGGIETIGGSVVHYPISIAIDAAGNAWTGNDDGVSKFSSGGSALSPVNVYDEGYTSGGTWDSYGIAIDGSGSAWTANYYYNDISEFSSAGAVLSPSPSAYSGGYTGGGLDYADSIALDASGNAWVANNKNNSISKFSNAGVAISSTSGFTGGGLNAPYSITVDGAGTVWTANNGNSTVSRFSSAGVALSPSTGYSAVSLPYAVAIDGSGDAWVAGYGGLVELIGIAAPVITPICAGLPSTPTSKGTSNLGTRP